MQCRTIDLEMPKPDGSNAELSVIRPLWWLQGTGAAVGGSIDIGLHEIGLHEIGLSGEATVLARRRFWRLGRAMWILGKRGRG